MKPLNPKEAPEGYIAKDGDGCKGCAFYNPKGTSIGSPSCGYIAAKCLSNEREDGHGVIFVKAEESQEEKHTVDPTEAPEGLIAVLRGQGGENDCPSCVYYGRHKCKLTLCTPDGRKDKCDVIFKEICTAPKAPDCEAIPAPDEAFQAPAEAMVSNGKKFDLGKPRLELLDRFALEQTALVLNFGAEKYAAWNWAEGIQYSRLIGAALRHIEAYNDGEDLDPESGLPHTTHAMCCLMFLLGMQRRHPEMDDRFKFVKETK